MPPAARLTDLHTCPMVTIAVPHVGGPITAPGVPTVLIGGLPAATVTNICTCTGPPDTIAMGSPTVLIGGLPAARMGDPTVHGGIISSGCPTVDIGGPVVTLPPDVVAATGKALEEAAEAELAKKAAEEAARIQALAQGLPPPPPTA